MGWTGLIIRNNQYLWAQIMKPSGLVCLRWAHCLAPTGRTRWDLGTPKSQERWWCHSKQKRGACKCCSLFPPKCGFQPEKCWCQHYVATSMSFYIHSIGRNIALEIDFALKLGSGRISECLCLVARPAPIPPVYHCLNNWVQRTFQLSSVFFKYRRKIHLWILMDHFTNGFPHRFSICVCSFTCSWNVLKMAHHLFDINGK